MTSEVLVVIGVGGMGKAVARRLGNGRSVLLADFDEGTLRGAADALRAEGHAVTTRRVDVSSSESVRSLAEEAAGLGAVTQVVHTAGLSPAQAPPRAILEVDLYGVALVLEEFGAVVARGGAGVVISSMAAYLGADLAPERERDLAHTPASALLELPFLSADAIADSGTAYGIAKRANHLRVQAAAVTWGDRGARVNSISPGVISTPMGHQELGSEVGEFMRALVEASATGRLGTPDDIAAAAAFLLGPDASFITGVDLLVDGGVVAAVSADRLSVPG